MKTPIKYLGTGDAAKAANIPSRSFQRLVARGEITPDAVLQTRTHNVALWNPNRLERLKSIVSIPEKIV
jgi:hypothetical protein